MFSSSGWLLVTADIERNERASDLIGRTLGLILEVIIQRRYCVILIIVFGRSLRLAWTNSHRSPLVCTMRANNSVAAERSSVQLHNVMTRFRPILLANWRRPGLISLSSQSSFDIGLIARLVNKWRVEWTKWWLLVGFLYCLVRFGKGGIILFLF